MSASPSQTFVEPPHHGDWPSVGTSLIDLALPEGDDGFRDLFEDEDTTQDDPQQDETTPNFEGGLGLNSQEPGFTENLVDTTLNKPR
jgi:hypothetical protein